MLQAFQNIFICNFWTSIQFYIDFLSLVTNLQFEFQFKFDLNRLTGAAALTRLGDASMTRG